MKRIFLFLLFLGVFTVSQATIYYVKETAEGLGNGTSWSNASGDLQGMINAASSGDTVWVAEGTYKPNRKIDEPLITDLTSRDNSFTLKDGVVVLGGFHNTGNPGLSERNWVTYSTILSGDIGIPNDSIDNCFHVVVVANAGTLTVLDGFTIMRGNADSTGTYGISNYQRSRGGGLFSYNSSARFFNLIVRNNYASVYGGGINTRGYSPEYTNILIYNNNNAGNGGGVSSEIDGTPKFTNVTISNNLANTAPGGGFVNNSSQSPSFYNSIIWGNTVGSGLGIYSQGDVVIPSGGSSGAIIYENCLVGVLFPASPIPSGIILRADPQFVNASAGDFSLKPNSPAIDTGDIAYLTGITTDLGANPRIYNSKPDLGAYEYQGVPILPDSNGIVYVNRLLITGDASGKNWTNAAKELADALVAAKRSNAVKQDSIRQIWVAEATYFPLYHVENNSRIENRDNAFVMVKDVQVYGGFPNDANDNDNAPHAGLTIEQARNTRNWETNPTTLSGDIGTPGDNIDNCYHVVISDGDAGTATLDGFIIKGGYADNPSSITIVNAFPRNRGGGISTNFSNARFANLIVCYNYASTGGGICNRGAASTDTFLNVLIHDNVANTSGGGVANETGTSPVFINVTVAKNVCINTNPTKGGGIFNNDASPKFFNIIAWGNTKGVYTPVDIDQITGSSQYANCLVGTFNIPVPAGIILQTDPEFVDTAARNFTLKPTSPAIDMGDAVCLTGVTTDLAVNPRIYNFKPDLGAYEQRGAVIIPDSNGIVYVNRLAIAGDSSGRSWFNAAIQVADALHAARYCNAIKQDSIRQIWVAEAIYFPLYSAVDNSVKNEGRDNAFVMVKNVQVYGGFPDTANDIYNAPHAGLTIEQARNTRDWKINPTILSGDRGTPSDNTDDCYHVVISADDVDTATLDGFIITKGMANDNKTISVNSKTINTYHGSGIYCIESSPLLKNLVIEKNQADSNGGGIYIYGGMPYLVDGSISENEANNGAGLSDFHSSYRLINVVINKNRAATDGGGIYTHDSSPILTNVLLVKNRAENTGGGIYSHYSLILTNVTISTNVAGVNGGGMYNTHPANASQIRNSIIWGNTNTGGTANNVINTGIAPDYLHCLVEGEAIVAGKVILDEDPLFVDTINDNYRLTYCSPAINMGRNTCFDPASTPDLSAITVDLDSNARIFGSDSVDLGAYEFQGSQILPSLVLGNADTTICYGDTLNFSFTIESSSNPCLVYTKDYEVTKDTLNISTNPFIWKISPTDTTTYQFLELYDDNCTKSLSDSIRVNVIPKPTLTNILTNDTLCHNDTTKPITFTGTATDYDWISEPQIDNIPTSQTGHFGKYKVENNSASDTTTTIQIIPKYISNSLTCTTKDTSRFTITVLPLPTISNSLVMDTLCHGAKTDSITFVGHSNAYKWISVPQIDNIPTAQTGHFGKYTVENFTTKDTTTWIRITPQYVLNGHVCEVSYTINFSITVLPQPTVTISLPNDTLCDSTNTTPISFAGTATAYEWISEPQINGMPTGIQTGNFGAYTVKNSAASDSTTTIKIIPQYTLDNITCKAKDTSNFTITVFPKPTLTNTLTDDTLCHGSETNLITFTGNANTYKWISDPKIDSIPTNHTGNFGKYTVVNFTTTDTTTTIKVIPQYVLNGRTCETTDTSGFTITVLRNPTVSNIPNNDTICSGSTTTPVVFSGTASQYQWENVNSVDTIPVGVQTGNFGTYPVTNTTNDLLTADIKVTPQYIRSGYSCNGKDTTFSIVVKPLPSVMNIPFPDTLCNGEQNMRVTFMGPFSSVQWENIGDTIDGLPLGVQTGHFSSYTLTNKTDTIQTAIINVKAENSDYGSVCLAPDTNFKIRVIPTPRVNNLPPDTIVLCSGSKTQPIVFSGVATSYQWQVRGDTIDGLPLTPQTGDFGEYTLENKGSAPLTAFIDVTPFFITGGKTCTGADSTFPITVNPIPEVEHVPADYYLCSGDTTTSVVFGTAVNYEWTLSGDLISGLPTGTQTGAFGNYTVVNKTMAPLTAIVTVAPVYTHIGSSCTVKDTTFKITVNPEPSITNNLSDQILCSGDRATGIIFTGAFTNYSWKLNGNISGIPTGTETGDFEDYLVENKTSALVNGEIIIDVYYNANNLNCVKQDTLFSITVNPEPTLTNILTNDTLCNGDNTTPVIFTGDATSYEWIASGYVQGLPTGVQTGDFGVYTLTNNFSSPLTSTVTVTPKYAGSGIVCSGIAQQFEVIVNPVTVLDSITPNAFFFCEGNELRIKASASGGDLRYQWYFNGAILSGEVSDYYIVPIASRINSGVYQVEVFGVCGTVKSPSVTIDIRDEKMLVEKWHDVILVDNSLYTFIAYQWYRNGIKISGATEQFYQEIGGLNGCYSVEMTMTSGSKIVSCERCLYKTIPKSLSIHPNPAKQGTPVNINLEQENTQPTNGVRIEIFNTNGQLVLRKQVNDNASFEIETKTLSAGIYILRMITNDETIRHERIVIY
jgi:hypothetical protein